MFSTLEGYNFLQSLLFGELSKFKKKQSKYFEVKLEAEHRQESLAHIRQM